MLVERWKPEMSPSFSLVTLLFVQAHAAEFIQTLIGGSVRFASTETCGDAGSGSLVHVLSRGSLQRDVAVSAAGVWRPGSGYEDRLSPGDVVVLKDAAFSDNGVYELDCNLGNYVIIQVEVLVPFEVSVLVGQFAKLQCHFQTGPKPVQSVRWDRGAELVFEQNFTSGKKVYGERFKDRAEMSQDAYSRGDLSITLHSVQDGDQGEYYCKIQVQGQEQQNGEPAAVRLVVSQCPSCMWIIILIIIFTVLALVIGFVCGCFFKGRNNNTYETYRTALENSLKSLNCCKKTPLSESGSMSDSSSHGNNVNEHEQLNLPELSGQNLQPDSPTVIHTAVLLTTSAL